MSIAQIREQIDALSYEERVELAEWLHITTPLGDDEDEEVALAEKRSEELRTGKARLLTEEEFWAGVQLAKKQRRAS
ncbi:hypothetical protein EI77_00742 [Prosthecobacter fusiformis]|uniref:Addiction module component n=1 Tax=Prosthecobacter fusiformis TaxID=48464 RepID=A0A4R7SR64_9BACT|nr:hypothetical protein [Prosthecobacter fusiformis]TDU81434.1 hypothetical protein EI77_00742 [Prosthecobacter fusiformis]